MAKSDVFIVSREKVAGKFRTELALLSTGESVCTLLQPSWVLDPIALDWAASCAGFHLVKAPASRVA